MKRWLGAPALHFLVLGAILFALRSPGARPDADDHGRVREPIVITAARVAQIRSGYERETGLTVDAEAERALLRREIDDELLYREALAHGLDKYDRSVRWRLLTKMRFLGDEGGRGEDENEEALYREALELGLDREDIVIKRILIHKMRLLIRLAATDDDPTDSELREFFRDHVDDYMQPGRITFTHVYLSAGKRGERLADDADAILARLIAEATPPDEAPRRGDAFTLGHTYRSKSLTGVEKIFGQDFGREVFALEPGAWAGPIRSPYGLHLVFVESREDEKPPAFEAVRRQVLRRLVSERRDAYFNETLERLRDQYDVRIEGTTVTERADR